MKYKYTSLALLFISLLLNNVVTASPLNTSDRYLYSIAQYSQVITENDGQLTLNQVKAHYHNQKTSSSTSSYLSLGIGSKPVWLIFEVNNEQAFKSPKRLSIETSWLDNINAYFIHDGRTLSHIKTGDQLPFTSRPVENRFFVFDHDYKPGNTTVFIRVESIDPLVIPIYFKDLYDATNIDLINAYSYGFLYGGIIILLIYNLILYRKLKEPSHLYYSLYMLAFLATNLAYTGHGFYWLWPESTSWQMWSNPILMVTFCLSGLLFATHFLTFKQTAPKVHNTVIATCITMASFMMITIIVNSQLLALLLAFSFVFLFGISMLLLGFIALKQGNKLAIYFLFATMAGSGGAAITGSTVWGLIPYNPYSYLAVEMGMIIEAVVLALALATRVNLLQQEKDHARALSRLDPLTGLHNRRSFYEKLRPIWERARQNITVIMIDIDHFKTINDSYGHTAGDEVLLRLASTFVHESREEDFIARWGGEEFIIFIPDTPLEEAVVIAERYRLAIARLPIVLGGKVNSYTASFGIAQRTEKHSSLDDLISEADQYLYQAKNNGRNTVFSRLNNISSSIFSLR